MWLHDASPVICNHIASYVFPVRSEHTLPAQLARQVKKGPHLCRITVETPGGVVSYPAPAPIFPGPPRTYAAVPALGAGYRSGERMSRDPAPPLCRAASREALGIGPDCRRLGFCGPKQHRNGGPVAVASGRSSVRSVSRGAVRLLIRKSGKVYQLVGRWPTYSVTPICESE